MNNPLAISCLVLCVALIIALARIKDQAALKAKLDKDLFPPNKPAFCPEGFPSSNDPGWVVGTWAIRNGKYAVHMVADRGEPQRWTFSACEIILPGKADDFAREIAMNIANREMVDRILK